SPPYTVQPCCAGTLLARIRMMANATTDETACFFIEGLLDVGDTTSRSPRYSGTARSVTHRPKQRETRAAVPPCQARPGRPLASPRGGNRRPRLALLPRALRLVVHPVAVGEDVDDGFVVEDSGEAPAHGPDRRLVGEAVVAGVDVAAEHDVVIE